MLVLVEIEISQRSRDLPGKPFALVNSVMISPQPPKPRITRRKIVSVTPAIGAKTVAGRITESLTL